MELLTCARCKIRSSAVTTGGATSPLRLCSLCKPLYSNPAGLHPVVVHEVLLKKKLPPPEDWSPQHYFVSESIKGGTEGVKMSGGNELSGFLSGLISKWSRLSEGARRYFFTMDTETRRSQKESAVKEYHKAFSAYESCCNEHFVPLNPELIPDCSRKWEYVTKERPKLGKSKSAAATNTNLPATNTTKSPSPSRNKRSSSSLSFLKSGSPIPTRPRSVPQSRPSGSSLSPQDKDSERGGSKRARESPTAHETESASPTQPHTQQTVVGVAKRQNTIALSRTKPGHATTTPPSRNEIPKAEATGNATAKDTTKTTALTPGAGPLPSSSAQPTQTQHLHSSAITNSLPAPVGTLSGAVWNAPMPMDMDNSPDQSLDKPSKHPTGIAGSEGLAAPLVDSAGRCAGSAPLPSAAMIAGQGRMLDQPSTATGTVWQLDRGPARVDAAWPWCSGILTQGSGPLAAADQQLNNAGKGTDEDPIVLSSDEDDQLERAAAARRAQQANRVEAGVPASGASERVALSALKEAAAAYGGKEPQVLQPGFAHDVSDNSSSTAPHPKAATKPLPGRFAPASIHPSSPPQSRYSITTGMPASTAAHPIAPQINSTLPRAGALTPPALAPAVNPLLPSTAALPHLFSKPSTQAVAALNSSFPKGSLPSFLHHKLEENTGSSQPTPHEATAQATATSNNPPGSTLKLLDNSGSSPGGAPGGHPRGASGAVPGGSPAGSPGSGVPRNNTACGLATDPGLAADAVEAPKRDFKKALAEAGLLESLSLGDVTHRHPGWEQALRWKVAVRWPDEEPQAYIIQGYHCEELCTVQLITLDNLHTALENTGEASPDCEHEWVDITELDGIVDFVQPPPKKVWLKYRQFQGILDLESGLVAREDGKKLTIQECLKLDKHKSRAKDLLRVKDGEKEYSLKRWLHYYRFKDLHDSVWPGKAKKR